MTKLVVVIGLIVILTTTAIFLMRPNDQTTKPSAPTGTSVIKYLPLGDSYTIGESVSQDQRWPNQLVATLRANGLKLEITSNPSVTGYTTQDLIDEELPLLAIEKPDFVTILIGVNDYVQGMDTHTFENRLGYIVVSVQKQLPNPKNILLVTIPDYGKTPAGARFGSPTNSEKGIKQFNGIINKIATQHGLPVADIFAASQAVVDDKSLVANDGLHPSGKQYTEWTKIIYQTVQQNKLPLAN